MITNIVASVVVSLVTNTSETLPKHMVTDPPPPGLETLTVYRGHAVDDENPKEKWVTTKICEVTTVRFNAMGNQYEARSERVITNWTTHFLISAPRWVADTNNAPIPDNWFGR